MSSKIEGVPEGWELVRIGEPVKDQFYIGPLGETRVCRWDKECTSGCAIVRKIEPPKPLIIEAGKWYRLRGGDIVGPIKRSNFSGLFTWTDGSLTWTHAGSYNCSGDPSAADIVDEVPSPEPPKPVYVPWTYETCPLGVHVECLDARKKGMITGAGDDGARIGATVYSYAMLLNDWQQLDGTPCGTIAEVR